jgi:threonine dehydrogenase-like Zn-dependent dehydrogenase
MADRARALWIEAAGRALIRDEVLAAPGPGEVRVRTVFSGVSRGTESLVFHGRVPPSEYERMRGPNMAGAFPFPVKYGYCAVGVVETPGHALDGATVFALHPHQTAFNVAPGWLARVPDGVPSARAVLAANMETALNAVWDAGVGPGDRVAVVGAGVAGCLVAHLAARMPGTAVVLVDIDPAKAEIAAALDVTFAAPADAPTGCDVVVHTSATAAGLDTALSLAGFEATVVELSWFGEGRQAIALGDAFHSQRLTLRSSQVGSVSPSRRARWPHARRLEKALDLLADARLDALLPSSIAFEALPDKLAQVLAPGSGVLCQLVSYDLTDT